jgi:hypothetical protein
MFNEPTGEFFGFGPGFAVRSHLTLSGLHVGCSWKRIAAAPAICGAEKEVPLIAAYPGATRFPAGAIESR